MTTDTLEQTLRTEERMTRSELVDFVYAALRGKLSKSTISNTTIYRDDFRAAKTKTGYYIRSIANNACNKLLG